MFYLIRHGEPDYSNNEKFFYKGVGVNFAPLTLNGIKQIKETSNDKRLFDADIIISSPYTRALQSAAILSKELHIDIIVEPDIFEWFGDKNYGLQPKEGSENWYNEFIENNGNYPDGQERPWENNDILKSRLINTLSKYREYRKVIVVCHGMLIRSVYLNNWMQYGEILEFNL